MINTNNLQVVIMAGGKGTRIGSIASDVPKPMISIEGKPVLEHQLDCLKRQGLFDATLIIGHLGYIIRDYFGNGHAFGMRLSYIEETEPMGTAGGLRCLSEVATSVLLINGDVIFDVDFERMYRTHTQTGADITLFTHPNNHPYDSVILKTNVENRIISWYTKEEHPLDYENRVNAGIHILDSKVIKDLAMDFPENKQKKVDLDREVLKPNLRRYKIFAYDSPEYVKDMGTPDRHKAVLRDMALGLVGAKNLHEKQKAVFLDRDGTINVHKGFIENADQIELKEGVGEAIVHLNASPYLVICVTNQPVIARGDCTFEDLKAIHNRLERLLGEQGAYLDDIIYCPHHPHKGFVGERPEYKIDCNCRKPKPGMLFEMAEKYNIDLSQSYMVGDSVSDMEAGIAAGCKVILISGKNTDEEGITDSFFDGCWGSFIWDRAESLLDATNKVLLNIFVGIDSRELGRTRQ